MPLPDPSQKSLIGFLTVISDPRAGLFGGYLVLNWAGRPLEFHCTTPVKPNRAQQILYGPSLEPYLYGEQIGRTLLSKSQHPPMFVCTDVPAALAARPYVDWPLVLVLGPPLLSGRTPPHPPGEVPWETCSLGEDLAAQAGTPLLHPCEPTALTDSAMGSSVEAAMHSSAEPAMGSSVEAQASDSPGGAYRMVSHGAGSSVSISLDVQKGSTWRLDGPHPETGRLVGFWWGRQGLAVPEALPEDYARVLEGLATLNETFDLSEPFGRIREAIEEARRGG